MTTKTILTMAIIAVLPFGAWAANISGDMYLAPVNADDNHPAPTTDYDAPYGRIDIDTADQEHIATTAYVKGAYNSAIAAVNYVVEAKQDKLYNISYDDSMEPDVFGRDVVADMMVDANAGRLTNDDWNGLEMRMLSAAAVLTSIINQPVKIYTTWDNDNATTSVTLGDINQ